MLYRRFGRTELKMPVFSCGGMRYQFKWQDIPQQQVPADKQANLETTIKRSVELGINHIETARGYGSSEMQLGQVLPKFPRDQIIVQTKVGPKADPQAFQADFEKSLKNLQLDYIDLLGIHGINTAELLDYSIRPGGCLDVVRKLQAQGKIRFVGFSTHGPTDIIIQTINTNQFDYVNLHWYYINQVNWQAIEAATRHDMGVFIISPSDKGGRLYDPPQKLVDLCAPLSPMVFNDLFCLSHSQVHTLSLGASKPSDFDEHLKTLDLLHKADEILPPILARWEQAAISTFGENWIKTWRVGLPKHEKTPGNINIRTVLWLRNLALAYDMHEYAKTRYNLLGNGSHWFPGNKAEGVENLDLRECLRNSPHAERIPDLLCETHKLLEGAKVKRLSQS
ncbi:aldo/keto reductase [Mastigocoleus testarum]|uniref:Aldo/keto reductase n=1 Tax=Mastigocoleus testarum BC008 TaxID=371196 RepID=A0A0V7ZWB4_9CYAN|nr:aldo/keto reductase [Mastigocoleus testarum]KST68924.1 aldo/keto reductase [Mastigocoleus testarum BC008]KST68993.1 aldo/keto reductase [Mastigocoleus testarum BC008]